MVRLVVIQSVIRSVLRSVVWSVVRFVVWSMVQSVVRSARSVVQTRPAPDSVQWPAAFKCLDIGRQAGLRSYGPRQLGVQYSYNCTKEPVSDRPCRGFLRCCCGCCCSVAVLLRWSCGSVAVVQAVVPFDGPVGGLVGGPVGGPVGCPLIDLVGELVIDLVSGLVGGPVRGLIDGPVCCPVGAVGGTSIMHSLNPLIVQQLNNLFCIYKLRVASYGVPQNPLQTARIRKTTGSLLLGSQAELMKFMLSNDFYMVFGWP